MVFTFMTYTMKKIIYFLLIPILGLGLFACDETSYETEGSWNYDRPYFEFEYLTDTVRFGMGNNMICMAAKDVKNMVYGMAAEKMQNYFTGIDFYAPDSLLIKARTAAGYPLQLHAHCQKDDQYLEVSLDPQDMTALLGEKAGMIPAISFRCVEDERQMKLYLGEVYIQSIFENTEIQKMILPMLARQLNPRFDMMPEPAQQAMLQGLQQQLSALIDNIQILKIGFILTR